MATQIKATVFNNAVGVGHSLGVPLQSRAEGYLDATSTKNPADPEPNEIRKLYTF
ncbi:uncharacterized protein METZ01_LOCUS427320 [marine metagenome]|uniref:Uncharacterized protein n=1 Tax=marine metagenome TaxID=408172 RepID=A0A382XTW6_9ZZZZ